MLSRAFVVAAALVAFAPHAHAGDARSDAKEQVEFGIKVAQNGLWKEAAYRWQKATEIDPTYAAAWNNLAVAYEQQGNFEKAREAYEKASAVGIILVLFLFFIGLSNDVDRLRGG